VRDWKLTATDPLTLRFAADGRLSRTDYTDDQVWELELGQGDVPALSIQTQYGGRVGLARLIPLLVFPDRAVFEAAGYAEPFHLRHFAPNYAKLSARPTPELGLEFDLWVMDSHVVGGLFTFHNLTQVEQSFRLELIPQVAREGRQPNLKLIELNDALEAVSFGTLVNINPVLTLEHSERSHEVQASSPKLSAALTIAPGASVAVRWVHAGFATLEKSASEALRWLRADWQNAFELIEKLNATLPSIETGDEALDALLAFKMQTVLRSYLGSVGKLPYPAPVATRLPTQGYSASAGVEAPGQTAQLLWLVAPTTALLAPDLARGALRNMLAARTSDGFIDWKLGLGGQRSNLLAFPLLASTAWAIYEITEDKHFLTEVLPGLTEFFLRWFARDTDKDRDGAPEWTNAQQAVQGESAIYNRFRRWAANVDIGKVETPELLALLLQEADALTKIEQTVGRKTSGLSPIPLKYDALRKHLATLWNETQGRFGLRDRDTHVQSAAVQIFTGKGDEWFSSAATLEPTSRLVIRVIGGQSHAPTMTVQIEGEGAEGKPLKETIPLAGFTWYYGFGSAVSENCYTRVTYVKVEGLSKAFNWELSTADLTGEALPHYLPLRSVENYQPFVERLLAHYRHAAGLAMSADPHLEADNPNHHAEILWNALIIDALLERGEAEAANALIESILKTELEALRNGKAFRGSYHAETGAPFGENDDLNGLFPLHLVLKAAGVRIVNNRRVWAGGSYALAQPITIRQYGVTVTRSASGTHVQFPTGKTVEVGTEWQLIEDDLPVAPPEPAPETPPIAAESIEPTFAVAPEAVPEVIPETVPALVPPTAEHTIPVQTQRDPTTEVDITHIDFSPGDPNAPPRTYKIKVNRSK
jgi:hypothetical protein